jgi:hypothetical protein
LETQCNNEEAANLKRQVPAPAYLVKFAKDHFGVDFIRNCGWSMAETEVVYGADWLAKEGFRCCFLMNETGRRYNHERI